MSEIIWLEDCTWKEAERAVKEAGFCVIPFGSFEQHGGHLPLNTDSRLARGILNAAGSSLSAGESSLLLTVLPVVSVGMSPEHADFPGTLSLAKETFFAYAEALTARLLELGAKRIVLFNSHGGNTPYLQIAAREYRERYGTIVLLFDVFSSESIVRFTGPLDYHAGTVETSLMLYLFPEAVRQQGAEANHEKGGRGNTSEKHPGTRSPAEAAEFFGSPAVPWYSSDFSDSGVIGDPEKADAALGKQVLDALIKEFTELLFRARKILSGGRKNNG